MKMKLLIGTCIIGTLIGVFAIASAASSGKEHRGGEGREHGEKFLSKLNLSADQQARIKTIREQFESDTRGLRDQMETLHQQMHEARQSNQTARIEELRAQSKPLWTRMQAAQDQMRQQISAVLTAEQRQQMEQMMAERKGRCQGHHEGRGEMAPESGTPGQTPPAIH